MLVLSRQRDESIIIGDDIEVKVVDIRGDKVRLGITAPKEISVHRKEVYDAIRRENREAAKVKPGDVPGLGKIKPGVPKSPPPPTASAKSEDPGLAKPKSPPPPSPLSPPQRRKKR